MNKTDSESIFSNLIWRLLERFGAQIVTLVVSIVLARILDPDSYGTIALVTVFISILQVFVDGGFGNALIQKKDSDNLDFSSVFYFNIIMCSCIYVLLFFGAPYIALFYNRAELTSIVRVLSLTVVFSGVKNIQQAYVSKNMLFKKFFYSTLAGTIVSAIVGIYMAYHGYGVWALITQHLINVFVDTVVLWITVRWRPNKQFSLLRLRLLFSFGGRLMVSALLDKTYAQIRALIIGKKYTSEDLAYYNRGNQWPELIITNINTSLDSVLLPSLSKEQNNKERVLQITRKAIVSSTYIIMPIMAGLAVCSSELIGFILTEKWVPSSFYMRIFCFTYALWPIHTANLNAIKALGKSDTFFRLELIKKSIGLLIIIPTVLISVKAMACSLLFVAVISLAINAFPNRKLLGYGILKQIRDIIPNVFASLAMGALMYSISIFNIRNIYILILQITIGILAYFAISRFAHLPGYTMMLNKLKSIKLRKGKDSK